jgi:hypothetical protein
MGHWLVDTAGIGSIVVLSVGFLVLAAYIYMLRWIQRSPHDVGSQDEGIVAEAGGEEA